MYKMHLLLIIQVRLSITQHQHEHHRVLTQTQAERVLPKEKKCVPERAQLHSKQKQSRNKAAAAGEN